MSVCVWRSFSFADKHCKGEAEEKRNTSSRGKDSSSPVKRQLEQLGEANFSSFYLSIWRPLGTEMRAWRPAELSLGERAIGSATPQLRCNYGRLVLGQQMSKSWLRILAKLLPQQLAQIGRRSPIGEGGHVADWPPPIRESFGRRQTNKRQKIPLRRSAALHWLPHELGGLQVSLASAAHCLRLIVSVARQTGQLGGKLQVASVNCQEPTGKERPPVRVDGQRNN